jgi:hypothetical protein
MNRALEFLRAIYSNDELPLVTRMRAAMACLPFETPKLAVTALIGENDFASLLDRRLENLKRMEGKQNGKAQPTLIETQPVIEAQSTQSKVEIKAPTPSINFRSIRRRI